MYKRLYSYPTENNIMFNKPFRFQAGHNNNNNNNKDSNNKNINSNFDKTELLDIKCGVPHGSIFRTTPF